LSQPLEHFLLGLVQGLTEFLPVSSSGHLVIFQKILGFNQHDVALDVLLHLATLAAVLTALAPTLKEFFQDLFHKERAGKSLKLAILVIVATIPTGFVGLLLKDFFHEIFGSMAAVGGLLIVNGFILFSLKFSKKDRSTQDFGEFSNFRALLIGVAQSFAICPGISRSGTTITAALFLGMKPAKAFEFSFLLSIPAILGAAVLELKDLDASAFLRLDYAIGCLAAYVSGVFALRLLLKLVKKGRFEVFAYYVWAVGAGVLIYSW